MKKFFSLLLTTVALVCMPMGVKGELNEGFETSIFPPTGWSVIHVSGNESWKWSKGGYNHTDGCASITYANDGHNNYLITPQFTPHAGDCFSFLLGKQFAGANYAPFLVEISTTTNEQSAFSLLREYENEDIAFDWTQRKIDLSAYAGQAIYIAFHVNDHNGSTFFLDNVAVSNLPASTPTNVIATLSNARAIITWDCDEDGASYSLRYRVNGSEAEWTVVNNIDTKTYTIEDLTNGTTYEAQVQASTSASRISNWTESVTFTPEACPTITGIELSEKTYKSVKVSWTASSVSTWVLEYRDNSSTNVVVEGLTEAEYTLTGLEALYEGNDNTYMIKVHPSCSDQGIDTTYAPKFTPPTNVQVINIADVTATASWNAVADAELGYTYTVVLRGNETWSGSKTTNDVSVNLTGLVPNTEYDFKVATRYPGGYTGYTSPGVIIPFKTGAPIAPKNLTVSNLYLDSATLSWENDGGATQYQYAVGNDPTALEWTNTNKKTVTFKNLAEDTEYTFYVRSFYNDTQKSDSIFTTFRTKSCIVSELPWNEGFEGCPRPTTGSPRCWTHIDLTHGEHTNAYVTWDDEYVRTGSQAMRFKSDNYYSGYLILPVFNVDLSNSQISFWHKEQNVSNSAIITFGYITNISDSTTFVAIKECGRYTDWEEEVISLATIPDGARMAFKIGKAGNEFFSGMDDITIYAIPDYDYKYFRFNANGGVGTMDGQEITATATLKPNTFTRENYTFRGWATSPYGDVVYADEAEITVSEGDKEIINLYAVWNYTNYESAIFNYGYDCQRNPGYPERGFASLYNFKNPYVGLNGIGTNIDNNPEGPWKVEYVEMYDANHATTMYATDKTEYDVRWNAWRVLHFYCHNVPHFQDNPAEFNAFAHDSLPVYRLYQWNGNEYVGVAYGFACARAIWDDKNNKGRAMLFQVAGSQYGCFLTDSTQSENISMWFDIDLTDGILTFPPISITTVPAAKTGLVYNKSAQALISAGEVVSGTMKYKVGNGDWSEEVPTATKAGTYTVYYKIVSHNTHQDSIPESNSYEVTIDKGTPTYITRPTAIPGLICDGSQLSLVTDGENEGGFDVIFKRGLEGIHWTNTPSFATAVGNYYVCYKIDGNDNYYDTATDTLITTIYASASPAIPSHDDYPANKISVLAYQQGANTGTQKADSLFDGNTSTKWCSIKWKTDAYSERPKDIVVWKTAESVKMVSYTLTTGNDTEEYPNRNWSSWTLYGGTFGSDEAAAAALRTETGWTIIDNQIQDSVMQAVNKTDYQFVCNNPGTYQYYRLVIHDIKYVVQGEKQDNIQQMAELTMGIEKATPPTDIEETNANANAKAVKILRDGVLYIERNGKTHTIDGRPVK